MAIKARLRENEDFDGLIGRFKTMVKKSGVLAEKKKREYFLKKGLRRKRKSEEAQKRKRR